MLVVWWRGLAPAGDEVDPRHHTNEAKLPLL